MEDTFIVGDLHTRIGQAQAFLNEVKPPRVIWMGDYMDTWDDSIGKTKYKAEERARNTGDFLYQITKDRPQDILLQGNHDTAYRFSSNPKYKQWGYTHDKNRAFHSAFPQKAWEKVRLIYIEEINGQIVLFSHAGFSPEFFTGSFNKELFYRVEKGTLEKGNSAEYNPWLDSPYGPQWHRWELPILDGVCQVVGHTEQQLPVISKWRGGAEWNLCVDSFPNYVVKFNDTGFYTVNLKTGQEHLLKPCSDITQY